MKLLLVLLLIGLTGWLVWKQWGTHQPSLQQSIEEKARQMYTQALARGDDLDLGPCLGTIVPNWVLDIAHSPRIPEDDLAVNQCADYNNGTAMHFIEMSPTGDVLQIR